MSQETSATLVGKRPEGEDTLRGRKLAMRRLGESGRAEAEITGSGAASVGDGNDCHLLVDIVKGGRLMSPGILRGVCIRHRESFAELPLAVLCTNRGNPAIETIVLDGAGVRATNPYQMIPRLTSL